MAIDMSQLGSLEEAVNFLGDTQEGQSILNDQIAKILKQEAERLERYIKEEINNYYRSYFPLIYPRTENWLRSLRIGQPKINDNDNTISMEIYFYEDLAYHPSIIDPDKHPMGYVPWLMEVGWHWRESIQPRRYRFSDFEGTHYIANAVKRFNEENPYKLQVMVFHGDERYL